jgi:hypothetical protein
MICFAIYMILFGIFLGAPFLYWAPYYIYGQSVMISSIILLGVLVLSELTTAILYLVSSTKIAKQ